mgnify:CR=1 FL=1
MQVKVFPTATALGRAAAADAAAAISEAVSRSGRARCIFATGASQFEFVDALVATPGGPWNATEFFHLDEYVGLEATHPASFRRYLRERHEPRPQPWPVARSARLRRHAQRQLADGGNPGGHRTV